MARRSYKRHAGYKKTSYMPIEVLVGLLVVIDILTLLKDIQKPENRSK